MTVVKYSLSKTTLQPLSTPEKGTKCVQILLSQVLKGMRQPLVPMFFFMLGTHLSEAKVQYPDLSWKEKHVARSKSRTSPEGIPNKTTTVPCHNLVAPLSAGWARTQHLLYTFLGRYIKPLAQLFVIQTVATYKEIIQFAV